MERHKSDAANGGKMADSDANEPADGFDELAESQDELIATAATVAVVGAGVIIFEAALLPGLVLGIATMLVPKYLPRLGGAVSPLVKSTVRGAYNTRHRADHLQSGDRQRGDALRRPPP